MADLQCRPFLEYSMTAQYTSAGKLWSFGWDGKFLCVSYPDQTVDEFLDVSRGVAQQIMYSVNPLDTFNLIKPSLIPVLMFTEDFHNGAWEIETGDYITTK